MTDEQYIVLFCSFQLTDHVVAATDHLRTNFRTITDRSRTKDFSQTI